MVEELLYAVTIQNWWAIEDSNLATSPHERDRISNHSKAYYTGAQTKNQT